MNPDSRLKCLALALTACLGLFALTPASAAEAPATYSFGVLSQRSPVLTAEYWNPILDYVSRKTGANLALKVARTAPESNDAMEKGEYDFVYSNTIFQPKMAKADYQVILRPQDEAITGQIVTLADSPVRKLKDLEGKEVGFPSLAAFVGYAVPMDQLLHQGVHVTPVFGGNQEGIIAQLKAGKVIAAGVNNQVMRAFASRENVQYRVLWESSGFLNIPIAAHPRVPKKVVEEVRRVLDDMDRNPEGLRILEASAGIVGQKPPYGFRASSPADYRSYSDFYRTTLVKDIK
ncbi:phosphate ABC transporter substrate-binding protein [Sulfurimicrobium lacus]|uniref:Phosphate ABC transporter substrate-binding protein n=1 Tax=Sulfurimicrobium lacus TaxID=2715678 RepID=A0A6F8VAT8_9PROT|nr:phosphate/phosphite/phosphonate ABC transporter substrate-binding protein [Sulfurimicrobium lacus]BCB26828.1 phosphate ABC transporter substrate-binding protein [Sulfurimicrobium lacus]